MVLESYALVTIETHKQTDYILAEGQEIITLFTDPIADKQKRENKYKCVRPDTPDHCWMINHAVRLPQCEAKVIKG